MTIDRIKFGDLNPVDHPNTGHTLDTSILTGYDVFKKTINKTITPTFTDKAGLYTGIVLRVEKADDSRAGFFSWLFDSSDIQVNLPKYKIRIPELHAHLPDPVIYGDQRDVLNPDPIIDLYTTFVAKDNQIGAISVGDLVYCDFADQSKFENPVCLGPVTNARNKIGAFGPPTDPASEAVKQNNGELAVSSAGDQIASGEKTNNQNPTVKPAFRSTGKIGDVVVTCEPRGSGEKYGFNVKDPLQNSPSCGKFAATPGQYPITEAAPEGGGKYIELGTAEMVVWENRNGKKKLVRAELEKSLRDLEAAFIKETGLKEKDVKQFINSGYRSFEEQACFREKWVACRKVWRDKLGSDPKLKPSGVGLPGPGKHSKGVATDFNRVRVRNRNRAWKWLAENAHKFGWVWTGGSFNPVEPWHYEFKG
jgi:hypothetical protein